MVSPSTLSSHSELTLAKYTAPPPRVALDATKENPFNPFARRVAFEFADFHFVDLQSSEARINRGLDQWLASVLEAGGEDIPWRTAAEMYATIDRIQQGHNPWRIVTFYYNGPRPANPPAWMVKPYELCTRDLRLLLHEQLACIDFDGHFDYIPYMQFNSKRDCVWSNLMSADWAAK
jgi:hypothetical protein